MVSFGDIWFFVSGKARSSFTGWSFKVGIILEEIEREIKI